MNPPVPKSLASFSVVCIFIITCSLSSLVQVQARQFRVGGRDGWVVHPAEDYDHWAGRNRFLINDTLLFKYKKGENSVLRVKKGGYDQCDAHDPIKKWDDGDTVVQLDRSGPFYFISGQDGNCRNGQKLHVVVLAVRPLPLPPPKAPPPGSSSPTPATAPGAAPGSKPPGSSTPAKSPAPSASPATTPTHAPAMGPSSLSPSPTAAPGSSTPATSPPPSTSPATTPTHAPATGPPSPAPTATAPASGPTAPGAPPPAPSTTSPPPGGSGQSSPPAATPAGGVPGNVTSPPPGNNSSAQVVVNPPGTWALAFLTMVLVQI